MKTLALFILWLAVCTVGCLVLAGCMDPATRQKIHDSQQQSQLRIEQTKEHQHEKDAQTEADPARHPFAAFAETVRELLSKAKPFAWAMTVACLACYGMTYLKMVPILPTVARVVMFATAPLAVFGWIAVFALPFLGWVLGITIVGLVAWLVERIIALHSVAKGTQKFVAELLALLKNKPQVTIEGIGPVPAK